MPELSGSLRDFPLAEVVTLLSAGRKTGVLTVEGDDGAGTINFSEGRIVHRSPADNSETVTEILVDMLVGLARLPGGVFGFQAGVDSVVAADALHDAQPVLTQLDERLLVWSEVETVIGSVHDRYVIAQVQDTEAPVELLGSDWNVLAALGGGASAYQIAKRVKIDEFEVAEAFGRYLDAGLIEPQPEHVERAVPVGAPQPEEPYQISGGDLIEPRHEVVTQSDVVLDLTDRSADRTAEVADDQGEAPASELAARWRELRASRSESATS